MPHQSSQLSAGVISRLLTFVILGAFAGSATAGVVEEKPFQLRHVGSTPIEIVLSWTPVPEATGYRLERSTSPAFALATTTRYDLPSTINTYGDTGLPPTEGRRFFAEPYQASQAYALEEGQSYFYRVHAQRSTGPVLVSDIVEAQIEPEPVRGVAGDLWADVVLGQPTFSENAHLQPTSNRTDMAAGIAIDRRTTPNHLYVVDANNNRILGFDRLGSCRTSKQACTADADCGPGGTCLLNPQTIQPAVVLGQPDVSRSACNGDQTIQTFRHHPPARDDSLCLSAPGAISPRETVLWMTMAIDSAHNLYVADPRNHRVLMYKDPFQNNPATGHDARADAVWGQADFTGYRCNRGQSAAALNTLCLADTGHVGAAVALDSEENLWVADTRNHRVVRFPKSAVSGLPRDTADIVFLTSYPLALQVDQEGNVYVTERVGTDSLPSRVVKYLASSIHGGNSALGKITLLDAATLNQALLLPSNKLEGNFTVLRLDPRRPGLWIQGRQTYWYDFATSSVRKMLKGLGARGLDVDGAGNVFVVEPWVRATVQRYRASAVNALPSSGTILRVMSDGETALWTDLCIGTACAAYSNAGTTSMPGFTGMALHGNQLIVTNLLNIQYWDDYRGLQSGQRASGSWSSSWDKYYASPRVDTNKRLWVSSYGRLLRFPAAPLRLNSSPTSIGVRTLRTNEVPPQYFSPKYEVSTRFAPIGSGNAVWLVDANGRVVRLTNLDGVERSGPYVDVVLGKPSLTALPSCSGDQVTFRADTLCNPVDVRLDADGNLWVVDKPIGYDGGATRLLRYDAHVIEQATQGATRTVYGIPASAVYGTNGRFDVGTACYSRSTTDFENGCHLFVPAFDQGGRMVTGSNPYTGPRFPLVYVNPRAEIHPQFVLADMTTFLSDGLVDPDGNLYLGDWNWNRVLIYHRPFERLFSSAARLDTLSPSLNVSHTREADTITVTATAADEPDGTGLATIELAVNGQYKVCARSPSCDISVTAPDQPGEYTYTATARDHADNVTTKTSSFTIINTAPAARVATPTISPGGGSFSYSIRVTVTSDTVGSTIYYTTNGLTPTISSTRYLRPFTLTTSATVKAIAIKSGMTPSAMTSATFTKQTTSPPSPPSPPPQPPSPPPTGSTTGLHLDLPQVSPSRPSSGRQMTVTTTVYNDSAQVLHNVPVHLRLGGGVYSKTNALLKLEAHSSQAVEWKLTAPTFYGYVTQTSYNLEVCIGSSPCQRTSVLVLRY